jgi:hypothetical protein
MTDYMYRSRRTRDGFNASGSRRPTSLARAICPETTGDCGLPGAVQAACLAYALPEPILEYRFNESALAPFLHPKTGKVRKWRFDMLFEGWLAVEIQGGVWVRGKHSRGKGQINDFDKLNAAQILGYTVLQFTPDSFDSGEAWAMIAECLEGRL